MESIDKNDVDITKLFGWKGKLTILDEKENPIMDVYMRLVGDADSNRARVYALRESAKTRKELHDKDNLDRFAYIMPEELVGSEEDLINMLLALRTREFMKEAFENTVIDLPTEPRDKADLEEQEEYQKQVDEWPSKRMNAIKDYITKKVAEAKEEYLDKSKHDLYTMYEKMIIDITCEFKMIEDFKSMCIYYSTFKDDTYKVRLFSDFDEYENLPPAVKTQLKEFYSKLEVGTEDLKK